MTQVQRTLAYLWSVEPAGATNADLARHLGTSHQTVYMLTQDLLRLMAAYGRKRISEFVWLRGERQLSAPTFT